MKDMNSTSVHMMMTCKLLTNVQNSDIITTLNTEPTEEKLKEFDEWMRNKL